MPIKLDVKPTLDESAARREAAKAERVFERAGKGIGQSFGKQFTGGLQSASSDVQKLSREFQRMYDKAADSAGKLAVEEKKLAEVRAKGVDGSKLVSQVERTNTARRAEARNVREVAAAYQELQQAQRGGGKGFSAFGKDAAGGLSKSFTDAFKGGAIGGMVGGALAGALTGVFGKLENIAMTGGRAVAAAFQSSMTTGIDFQRIQNEFQGVTQATKAQVAQMKAKAQELGSDVTLPGVSASGAGKAISQLTKGGFTIQQSMDGARGVLELATAAQVDAADAAEVLGDAINMFQLHASDATHVADVFASAVQGSSLDMRDLQLAMQMGGSMAHGFGMSIEQTSSAIGALANAGIKGSDAGTLIKTMLKQLTAPSDEVAGALNELGITVEDSKGHFIGFESVLGQLHRAATQMKEMDFDAIAGKAFGSDGIRAAILGGKNLGDMYRQLMGTVGRVGAAHEMAAAQMQGWPGVIEGVKNSVEGMQLSLFDAVDSIARGFGPGLVGSVDQFAGFLKMHQPEIIRFFTVVAVGATNMAQSFVMAGEVIMTAMAPMVAGITAVAAGIIGAVAGIARTIANIAAPLANVGIIPKDWIKGLREFGDGAAGAAGQTLAFNQTWAQGITTLEGARSSLSGLAVDITRAGVAAQQASQFSQALGKSHAEMRGLDIVIKDNTAEVTQRLAGLGIKVEQLPHGEVKVTANTAAGQQIIDAWRRQVSGTPINMPIRPVIADAGDFQAKMLEWIGQVQAAAHGGPAAGPPPTFSPNSPAAGVGGSGGSSWFNQSRGAAPSVGPALPAWAPPLPAKKPKGSSGGGGGGGGTHGSGYGGDNDGAFYFPPNASGVDAAIAYAQAQSGKPYGFGSAGPDLFDCSGIISDIYAAITGKPYSGNERYFTTESNFSSLGFERGFQPGAFNIGVRHGGPGGGHMAGTLPNGVNIESGGSGNGVRYGHGAAGAKDFQEQWHIVTPDMKGGGGRGRSATPVMVDSFGSQAQGSLGQIGTSLAGDMGLSEGLPGLAKWVTGFLANMAFAPMIGALGAVKQASGGGNGGGGLFGLFGGPGGGTSAGGGLGGGGGSGLGGGLPGMLGLGGAGTTPGAGPGAPGVGAIGGASAGLGMGATGAGYGADGQPGMGSIGTGAMGQAIGPGGLTTPKPIGRQMGKDAPQGGGMSFGGGIIGAAAGAAAGAGNMMAPGAGAGAQIGMDMLNRTAGYIAQLSGIGMSGLMETFALSDTAAADPTNSLIGRIITGVAGARPQLPNTAGGGGQGVAGSTQGDVHGLGDLPPQQQGQDPSRPWVNIENQNINSGQDANANNRQMAREMKSADAAQGAKRA